MNEGKEKFEDMKWFKKYEIKEKQMFIEKEKNSIPSNKKFIIFFLIFNFTPKLVLPSFFTTLIITTFWEDMQY